MLVGKLVIDATKHLFFLASLTAFITSKVSPEQEIAITKSSSFNIELFISIRWESVIAWQWKPILISLSINSVPVNPELPSP